MIHVHTVACRTSERVGEIFKQCSARQQSVRFACNRNIRYFWYFRLKCEHFTTNKMQNDPAEKSQHRFKARHRTIHYVYRRIWLRWFQFAIIASVAYAYMRSIVTATTATTAAAVTIVYNMLESDS